MQPQASRYKHPLESSAPLHQLGHNTTALGKSFDKRNATVWDTVIRKAVTLPSLGFQQSKFNIMLEQKKQWNLLVFCSQQISCCHWCCAKVVLTALSDLLLLDSNQRIITLCHSPQLFLRGCTHCEGTSSRLSTARRVPARLREQAPTVLIFMTFLPTHTANC